jgi:hypothetical protein
MFDGGTSVEAPLPMEQYGGESHKSYEKDP